MKKIKLNRTTKYLFSLGVIILAFNAFLGIVLTTQSAKTIKSLISARMLDVSTTAAALLDGDILERLEAEDVDTPEYRSALRTLKCFQENIELEYIYCVRDLGNKNFVFMIDPEPVSPGEFGQPVVYTEALYTASRGRSSVDDIPYEDEWGRFYSAYTPVFDSSGKVAAIVAVDFSADWYENRIDHFKRITVSVIVAAVLLSSVVFILISKRYSKNYSILEGNVEELSKGIDTLLNEVLRGSKAGAEEDENRYAITNTDDEIVVLGEKLRLLQRKLENRLSYVHAQAYVDGLTGLENRMAYVDRIKKLDEQIKEGSADFAIAVFDVNQLKIINDDFGHEEGDRIISSAARALKIAFRDGSIYRIGGDEFVVILEHQAPEDNCICLKRAIEDINKKSGPPELAISMGSAVFDKNSDNEYNTVFSRADNAMYEDKREFYKTHEDRRKK